MDEIEFDPDQKKDSTLPVPVKRETYYTTVHKDGKETLVPYNPGRFELLRATELVVSGLCAAMAASALHNGSAWWAAFFAVFALVEFLCGMTRAGGKGLGRFLLEEKSSSETPGDR